ncbi:MAG: alpha/beta hydrolase [Actinomycetota bacterium]
MQRAMLLVHSPLVGPTTMTPLASSLRERSFAVAVPDLTAVAQAPPPRSEWTREAVAHAAEGISSKIIVVGHSGAGALLPMIAEQLGHQRGPLIFVDAIVPPADAAHETSAAMRQLLDDITVDGQLPEWLHWWPTETIERLLPDPSSRHQLLEEMPQLPRAFYDEAISTPPGWARWPCAYLRLSAAYDDELTEANTRGWPSASIESTHLGLFTEPDTTAASIDELVIALTD